MISIEQIHPLIVHFPIVFFMCLSALDLFAGIRNIPLDGRGAIANLSTGLAVLAGLAATMAYVFGDIALDIALSRGFQESQTESHELLGTITAISLGLWGLMRAFTWYQNFALDQGKIWGVVLIEIVLTILIVTTAYFGGQLVYELGINVTIPAN